jgi:poly(A) polymerase Pap1
MKCTIDKIQEPETNSYFLCSKSALLKLMEKAEREKASILNEIKHYVTGGTIGINIQPVPHVMGWAVEADMTVNGEFVRHYDSVDLCFMELNEIMLSVILKSRNAQT